MNISSPVFLGLVGLLTLAALLRPARLVAVWVIAIMVFPLARYRVGPAPLYCYDLVMVVIIATFFLYKIHHRWPANVPRWHWWIIGVACGLTLGVGSILNGFSPEAAWICGHSALAWFAFALAVLASSSPSLVGLSDNLRLGLLAATILLTPVALIQYLDLPPAEWLMEFFYGDIGARESVERLRVGVLSNRAPGPHFAPTTFGGIAILALAAFWLVSRPEHRWQRWTMLLLSSVVTVCTVSRHVILAAALGVAIIFALAQAPLRWRIVSGAGVGLIALMLIAPSLGVVESWQNRTARLNEGFLQDENIAIRLLDGPMRLSAYLGRHPLTLLTGAGLEADKAAVQNNRLDLDDTGFVSNGLLLALYYLGLPGLVVYTLIWGWTGWQAWRLPRTLRAVPCGVLALAAILIVSDSYSFVYEPAVALLFAIAGLVAGTARRSATDTALIETGQTGQDCELANAQPVPSGQC